MSGSPAALNFPGLPAFRKGLRGQKKLCLFQSLRNAGTIGQYNDAGAPEIAGGFWNLASYDVGGSAHAMGSADGAFYTIYKKASDAVIYVKADATHNTSGDGIGFMASRYASTYGASDTIMPASADIVVGIYLGCVA